MGQYVAPLREIQFVLHELLLVEAELKQMPKHSEIDAAIINQVMEEGGRFTSKVLFPLGKCRTRSSPNLSSGPCRTTAASSIVAQHEASQTGPRGRTARPEAGRARR